MVRSAPELSVVIPVLDEEANIPLLYDRLRTALGPAVESFELIFVNDGSRDGSLAALHKLAALDGRVRYVDLTRNFGQQVALCAGLDRARGELIATMDGDLQHPPEVLPQMVERVREGHPLVYGRRRGRAGEGWFKRTASRLFNRVFKRLTGIDMVADAADFRLFTRDVLHQLSEMPESQKFLRGQLAWLGYSYALVDYDGVAREGGKPGYTLSRMLRLGADAITGFSILPLRFATLMGFVVSGISFALILYALISRLIVGSYEPGWASLMVSLLFIGGIQLIAIGIIGEYMGRINENVRDRPLYVVRESNAHEPSELPVPPEEA
ncbi:MAG: glycosyltransferase family 2 protein [Deltaproteobacteria bacterium]|nr:glycosyltransferase family 2 protein [Deltaproteobacteria bacterium]MBW2387673.1 glycosyltransferase family 2 protein [Deltaproteobacteria bacterium]